MAVALLVVGVGVAVLFLLGFLFFFSVSPSPRPPVAVPTPVVVPTPPVSALPPGTLGASGSSWVFSGSMDNLCLVDVNGDGNQDVIGAGHTTMGLSGVAAVDSQDGHVLWTSLDGGESTNKIHCTRTSQIVVSHNTFRIDRLDPATGTQSWTAELTDKVQHVAAAPGCLVIGTIDKKTATLDQATGKRAPCTSSEVYESWITRRDRWAQKGVAFGDIVVKVSVTSPGTKRHKLEAFRGAKSLWSKVIDIEPRVFVDPVAGPDGILISGHVLTSRTPVFAYVKAETGDELLHHEDTGSTDDIVSLATAHGRVYLLTGKQLRAVDIATARELWSIGR